MHKFFVPKENVNVHQAVIEGEDVKHIYKVLRLESGEEVSINNCNGEEYLGVIEEVNKSQVIVKIKEKLSVNNEASINVFLFQGLPKSTKMDLIVQKNCELGVREITPIITDRVVVKGEIGQFKKVDRWVRIALEAAKQSKRTIIPEVREPIEFDEALAELKDMDLVIVPYENEKGYGVRKVVDSIDKGEVKNVGIVIGPEGGFEESEIEKLKNIGAFIVTLGPRILRTETAGFVAASLIMYELGDLGGNI